MVYKTTSGNSGFFSCAVSGATTIAGSTNETAGYAVQCASVGATAPIGCSVSFKLTGLTAGSNTFTMKYRCDGGTFHFFYRNITVERLN